MFRVYIYIPTTGAGTDFGDGTVAQEILLQELQVLTQLIFCGGDPSHTTIQM